MKKYWYLIASIGNIFNFVFFSKKYTLILIKYDHTYIWHVTKIIEKGKYQNQRVRP